MSVSNYMLQESGFIERKKICILQFAEVCISESVALFLLFVCIWNFKRIDFFLLGALM